MAEGSRRRTWSGLRRARAAILLALVPGLVGVGLIRWPPAEGLERSGLDLLFHWRGTRQAPPGVVVVAIDDASYRAFEADRKETWPRGLHARLIRTLAHAGAKAVAFDAFPIFSPAFVAQEAEAVFPGRGEALMNEWRTRQFEYAWLLANRNGFPAPGDYDQEMRREVAASMIEYNFFQNLGFRPNLLSQDESIWIGISQQRIEIKSQV